MRVSLDVKPARWSLGAGVESEWRDQVNPPCKMDVSKYQFLQLPKNPADIPVRGVCIADK